MSDSRYFSLGPEAIKMLLKAGEQFGDVTLDAALARAIGAFAAIAPYAPNGVVTVLADSTHASDEEAWVDIEIARPRLPVAA